jgi:hypothetical protein
MSYNIKTIPVFERQAKRLVKKFPSLKLELRKLIEELKTEPKKGRALGYDCYKIRLAIPGKGKGKSGGARIITHVLFKNKLVFLLSVYDKSEIENLTDNELKDLIKLIPEN